MITPGSLAGCFPPIPTPFDAKGRVDLDHLALNPEQWQKTPLRGFVVLGSNGEAVLLTTEERLDVWKTAVSHSGSIAGDYAVTRAALKQAGVTVLNEDGEMTFAVKTLLHLPPMKGDRVAVITFSGAAGIMITDALERYGLRLASVLPQTIDAVARLSPGWMPLGNPLDIWPAVMLNSPDKAYAVALRAVLKDPHVDGVICVAIGPEVPDYAFLDVSDALKEVTEELGVKPVAVWLYGPNPEAIGARFESSGKILTYPTLERASWALSLLKQRWDTLARGVSGIQGA